MKRGTFPAALYGRTTKTLSLTRVIPVLSAVMLDRRRIRCGDLFIVDRHPIGALCQALVGRGDPDCAVSVRMADRTPAVFIQSFTATAKVAAQTVT